MPHALITGASQGLGRALAEELARDGWSLLIDARDAADLAAAAERLPAAREVVAIAGDVTDPAHRDALAEVVARWGRLDLLVHNASTLPASPQPTLAQLRTADLERTLAVNLVAPHALTRDVLPWLEAARGTVACLSSDAATTAYATWGAYGASKAALDHLAAVLAVERPRLRVLVVDPGDLRTRLHAQAAPGEDLAHLPVPEEVAPALAAALVDPGPSGRHRLADLGARAGGVA